MEIVPTGAFCHVVFGCAQIQGKFQVYRRDGDRSNRSIVIKPVVGQGERRLLVNVGRGQSALLFLSNLLVVCLHRLIKLRIQTDRILAGMRSVALFGLFHLSFPSCDGLFCLTVIDYRVDLGVEGQVQPQQEEGQEQKIFLHARRPFLTADMTQIITITSRTTTSPITRDLRYSFTQTLCTGDSAVFSSVS